VIELRNQFQAPQIADVLMAYNNIGKFDLFDIFEKEILEFKLGNSPDEVFDLINAYANCQRGS